MKSGFICLYNNKAVYFNPKTDKLFLTKEYWTFFDKRYILHVPSINMWYICWFNTLTKSVKCYMTDEISIEGELPLKRNNTDFIKYYLKNKPRF